MPLSHLLIFPSTTRPRGACVFDCENWLDLTSTKNNEGFWESEHGSCVSPSQNSLNQNSYFKRTITMVKNFRINLIRMLTRKGCIYFYFISRLCF